MPIKVGLMGFGRIGRNIFRNLQGHKEIQVVAISEIVPPESLAYLLKWDTLHGPFAGDVKVDGETLIVSNKTIKVIQGKTPADVKWSDHGVDIVIDASTKYRTASELEKHLSNGAKRVILTTPPAAGEKIDLIVPGLNGQLLGTQNRIVSGGGATVHCAALITKILHETIGINRAFISNVHAYTDFGRLGDVPNSELRTSRSAVENIIPTPSFIPTALEILLPALKGKLNGLAMNAPVPNGSLIDLVFEAPKGVTEAEVNQAVINAAKTSTYSPYVQCVTDPIVSSDVNGNRYSAIFDSKGTKVLGGNLVKTLTWYDNGFGYACRIIEMLENLAALDRGGK